MEQCLLGIFFMVESGQALKTHSYTLTCTCIAKMEQSA